MNKTPLRIPPRILSFERTVLFGANYYPIAVFVVTTADPPEKMELVQQDIFEHLVGGCLSVGSRLSKSNIVAIHHF